MTDAHAQNDRNAKKSGLSRILLCQKSKSASQNFSKSSSHHSVWSIKNTSKSSHAITRTYSTGENDDGHKKSRRRSGAKLPLKLMDFPEIVWPNIIKSLKNRFFALLITNYYDKSFTINSFLEGCTQAVSLVSSCVSDGNFGSLQGLVDEEAIQEVKNSYGDLDVCQRRCLRVDPRDIFLRFVYEIGMMFDDETERRFVEVTVVLQGFHGYHEAKERTRNEYYSEVIESTDRMYVCNYRFIREFTKGVEGDWSINKMNHFSPKVLTVKF